MSKGSLRRPESAPGKYAEGWERIFSKAPRKSTHVNTKRVQPPPYPSWVCHDCATAAGGVARRDSTWHEEPCQVCGMTKAVTQPRDYGYPRFK